jgi:hypothetical protein
MSSPRDLFRQEALEYQAGQHGSGELMRISVRWTEWGYWGLLVLVAAGLVAGYLVHVGPDPLLFLLAPALKSVFEHLHA